MKKNTVHEIGSSFIKDFRRDFSWPLHRTEFVLVLPAWQKCTFGSVAVLVFIFRDQLQSK